MRVFVARHGETTWNLAGRYQGRLESPLSPLGVRQANALADAMAKREVARVISSPLGRCMETARPTARRQNAALETDPLLLEIAHGTWEGRLRDEIAASDPQRYRAWRSDPANVGFDGGGTNVAVSMSTTHENLPATLALVFEVLRNASFPADQLDTYQRAALAAWSFKSAPEPYCEGLTEDGCELMWQPVETVEGDLVDQCVAYCPWQ